jgi:hypothetical protein
VKKLPPGFRLETAIDPITQDEVFLETWVVEHSKPKPTPEEKTSPVKMYTKYYYGSSAISFLDYLKTWIVE